MRLFKTTTLKIREFIGQGIPPYAILSHTWGDEEVTFQDWQGVLQGSLVKAALAKIRGACAQALKDGLEYIWIDMNCIDKTNSAELSEAINSMFAWYRDARVCYVYLVDVPDDAVRSRKDGGWNATDPFLRSRWFTRGWTLQELLAPDPVVFFSTNWKRLGTKTELRGPLSQITGVPATFLTGARPIWVASVAKRMSWMSNRVTTRTEDMAYSMLGIFDIHMPLIYGEGPRAFLRLQGEILRSTDDQSILFWEWSRFYVDDSWASVLAPCPAAFKNMGEYTPIEWDGETEVVPYSISDGGVSIRLPLVPTASPSMLLAVLEVRPEWIPGDLPYAQLCIPLQRGRVYRRLPFPNRPFLLEMDQERSIHIMARERSSDVQRGYISARSQWSALFTLLVFKVGFLVVFAAEVPKMEIVYSDPGRDLLSSKGILAFSFPATHRDSIYAAAVLKLRFKDDHESLILLGTRVNGETDNHQAPSFYCQVLPMERDSEISEVVAEVESSSRQINQDADFSNGRYRDSRAGKRLAQLILRSGSRQSRAVQVVYKDREKCEMPRKNAQCPTNSA